MSGSKAHLLRLVIQQFCWKEFREERVKPPEQVETSLTFDAPINQRVSGPVKGFLAPTDSAGAPTPEGLGVIESVYFTGQIG